MAKKSESVYDVEAETRFKGVKNFYRSFKPNAKCKDAKVSKKVKNYGNTVLAFIIIGLITTPLFITLLVISSDKTIRFENADTGLGIVFERPNGFATRIYPNGSIYYLTSDRLIQFDFKELSLICIDKQYMYDIINTSQDYTAFMFYILEKVNHVNYGFNYSSFRWYRNIEKSVIIGHTNTNGSGNLICKLSNDYYFIPFLRLQFKPMLGDYFNLLNIVFYDQYIPCNNVLNETELFKTGFGTMVINIDSITYNYDVDDMYVYKDFYNTKQIPEYFPAYFNVVIRNDLFGYTFRSVSDITN